MLSQVHVRALHDNPSAAIRADIAAAVAAELTTGTLSSEESHIAEEILAALAQDVACRVRQVLAEHVKDCPFLPRDIALTLARDIEDAVALPIIEYSPLLQDADLVALVRSASADRQMAVARRKTLSPGVADELVDTGNPAVVGVLLANDGAELSTASLLKTATRLREPRIQSLLVERSALPLVVCEVLVASVSKKLRDRLVEKHEIPAVLADELANHGREKALTEIAHCEEAEAVDRLTAHLHTRRRLTPMLVLRTLLQGDLCFFYSAMATLSGLPVAQARKLLDGAGPGGLRPIFQRAGLPPNLFPAFRVGVNAARSGIAERGQAAYTRHIVDQLTHVYDDVCPAGLEHVLVQLSRRAAPRETPSAT
jgi:uncharacterized protein (DUF2336 family)